MLICGACSGNNAWGVPAGWVILFDALTDGRTLLAARVMQSGDPSTVVVSNAPNISAVALNYGQNGVPSAPVPAGTGVVTPCQAPAAATWQQQQVVVEFWNSFGAAAFAISTNVNNPTTRVSVAGVGGGQPPGLFIVDYRQATPTVATTGDSANNAGLGLAAVSLGLGA